MAPNTPPVDPDDLDGPAPAEPKETPHPVGPDWAYDSCTDPLAAPASTTDGTSEDR